jgi:hypothetical protein
MKTSRFVNIVLLACLVTTSVFGMYLMSTMNHDDGVCAVPTMTKMDCSSLASGLKMARHHISGLQDLFVAIVIAAIASGIAMTRTLQYAPIIIDDALSWAWNPDPDIVTRMVRRFHRWLARLITQDAFTPLRVYDLAVLR